MTVFKLIFFDFSERKKNQIDAALLKKSNHLILDLIFLLFLLQKILKKMKKSGSLQKKKRLANQKDFFLFVKDFCRQVMQAGFQAPPDATGTVTLGQFFAGAKPAKKKASKAKPRFVFPLEAAAI